MYVSERGTVAEIVIVCVCGGGACVCVCVCVCVSVCLTLVVSGLRPVINEVLLGQHKAWLV